MKRLHGAMAVATLLVFGLGAPTVYTQQQGGRGRQGGPPTYRLWWAAKAKPGQYGTNKPHIKLVDLKARHKGQANWMEVVVNDENWHAEYNQGAPGAKIAPRMHPDTREFFAVVEGQMRFTLEGQPAPIVATPTSIINIPKKTAYSVEVIGDAPALWVDANQQNYKTLYPVADGQKPSQDPGFTVMKVGLNIMPGPYTGNNKPHFNLHDAEKDPAFNGQNVVQDDHMWAQAIWGYEKNLPPYDPKDKGHFHIGTAEWWVILEGQIRHNIETIGDFTSNAGDIVYAPPSTWHATRFAGPGPSCRLATSTYQFTSLMEVPQD
jgi:mannose-6-phosphate isomerase-like protein (cupin superfamily)